MEEADHNMSEKKETKIKENQKNDRRAKESKEKNF